MKQVSDAYKESMAALMREQSSVEVIFSNIDVSASGDAEWSSKSEAEYSEFDTLNADYDYSVSPYATLELNRWALDGSFELLPDDTENVHDGYVSGVLSGKDGVFSDAPKLVCSFDDSHTFPGLTLTFDTRTGQIPDAVTAEFYAGDELLKSVTAQVDSVKYVLDAGVEDCDKIILSFDSAYPYQRARLERIVFGIIKTFTNSDILSTNQSHDVDPLARRLPDEQLEFSIVDFEHVYDPDNPAGVYAYIEQKSPIAIRFGYQLPNGDIEWLSPDNYVLTSKPTASQNQATFSATGMVNSMTGTYYKGQFGKTDFYTLAESVLADADVPVLEYGKTQWVIDEALKEMYTSAPLPIDSHKNCLQLIAHACGCRLFTNDENIIHLDRLDMDSLFESDTVFSLGFDSITKDSQTLTKVDLLKSVDVLKYSYIAEDTARTLYEGSTNQTTLHIEFSSMAQDIQITVTGGTLVDSQIYAQAVDLTLSEGTKDITITGKTVSQSSTLISYPVNADGEVDKEENQLITEDDMCEALAERAKTYLQLRNTYQLSYRGNPELEVGAVIGVQTPYTSELKTLVLTDEITFNGSLSGSLKVKSLR